MGLLEPHGGGRRLLRRDALTPDRPVVIIHSLAHAVAALTAAAETGRPVVLASAPDAGIYGGPGWWKELIAAARAVVPNAPATALLDCGDDAGAAQAAIRAGIEGIVFTGRADAATRLADIAEQRGARLLAARPDAVLDLGADFFSSEEALRRRCADILASPPSFC
jgi:sugar/nucleoside kinase (ribokinase family)